MTALLGLLLCLALAAPAWAGLPEVIAQVKPSVVGIGTHLVTRRPPDKLAGTGFVVGEGNWVATNLHVVRPLLLEADPKERLVAYLGQGERARRRTLTVLAEDPDHDLVLLRMDGPPALPLRFSREPVREGEAVAFTGFPIGAVLGLYPVTHRGIVSAISPIAIPVVDPKDLDVTMIRRLRDPFPVLQLDATAYPGNSGSPLYRIRDGLVVGIVNSVFVKGSKEKVLSDPSGISYAIPVRHLEALMGRAAAAQP